MTRQLYLLDTCICIAWLRDKFGIRERINTVGFDNCCISEMTVAEKMIMVTENIDDFENIKGIQIENWIDRSIK